MSTESEAAYKLGYDSVNIFSVLGLTCIESYKKFNADATAAHILWRVTSACSTFNTIYGELRIVFIDLRTSPWSGGAQSFFGE